MSEDLTVDAILAAISALEARHQPYQRAYSMIFDEAPLPEQSKANKSFEVDGVTYTFPRFGLRHDLLTYGHLGNGFYSIKEQEPSGTGQTLVGENSGALTTDELFRLIGGEGWTC